MCKKKSISLHTDTDIDIDIDMYTRMYICIEPSAAALEAAQHALRSIGEQIYTKTHIYIPMYTSIYLSG